MTLAIKTYNVLAYEPQGVKPDLRIAGSILDEIEKRANGKFTQVVMPELVRLGLLTAGMSLRAFAELSQDMPPPVAAKLTMPEEERFIINTRPYTQLGGVPSNLNEFADACAQLAPGGVAVSFFNTACPGPDNDYEQLAHLLDQFPAVGNSTWIVTNSLRDPIPKNFMDLVTERSAGRPGGAAAKQLAVSLGKAWLVPIGDSIVIRSFQEAAAVTYDRLKYIRKMEGIAPPKMPSLGSPPDKG